MSEYTFEMLWPISVNEVTEEQIGSLSKRDFAKLTHALRERLVLTGHTKRAAVESVRRLKRIRSKQNRALTSLHEQELLNHEFGESPLLDSFFPKRKRKWINPEKRKIIKSFSLENFSIVDNPKSTIETLAELVKFEGLAKSARLNFLDLKVLDVAPYLVLGLLSRRMAPYITGGKISGDTQKVLEAVELRNFLGIQPFRNSLGKIDVWPFSLQERHVQGTTSPDAGDSITFQKVSDRLVDAVNAWLAALPEPRTLSGEAMGQISNIATETLNNAERHSREEGAGDWVMAGFMARRPVEDGTVDGDKYDLSHWYDCHLAFVNRGRPICDAIVTTPKPDIEDYIRQYQRTHSRRIGGKGCSEETLATVCAMQDNISSKPKNAGGKGMMTIVEVTNALSLKDFPEKRPKISVISGKSCVMFSDEFCGFVRSSEPRTGRTQFFNQDQCIDTAPSDEHVFDLDVEFPGTIIAVRFTLDPETMEALNDDSKSC